MACSVNRAPGSFPSAPGPSPARLSVQLAGRWLSVGRDGTLLWGHRATRPPAVGHLPCRPHLLHVSNLPPEQRRTPRVLCRVLGCSCSAHTNTASPQEGGENLDCVEINGTRVGWAAWSPDSTASPQQGYVQPLGLKKLSPQHFMFLLLEQLHLGSCSCIFWKIIEKTPPFLKWTLVSTDAIVQPSINYLQYMLP